MRFVALAFALFVSSVQVSAAPNLAAATFDKIKALKGDWDAKVNGQSIEINYEVASNGSAVIEHHAGMVSVYTLDGDSILLTHFCSAKNQPRLRATKFEGQTLEFDFVDGTNLKNTGHHIDHLSLKLTDADHVVETWSSTGDSKPAVFTMTRKKGPKFFKDNTVSFFEIPMTDSARAMKFYSAILNAKLTKISGEGWEMIDLPKRTNGGNNGALTKAEHMKPASGATTVYLYVDGDLNTVLNRVESAGGKVVIKKMQIPGGGGEGYFGLFLDSEGNTVGLHSTK